MSKTAVYDMTGNQVGEIELNDSVFGIEPNIIAMHEMVKNHLANKRQGTQSSLTRAEVSGGGKKPWKQKGTGHARQGSTRAPQWTHGGIVFAPKPRDYSYSVNKKLNRLAIRSALSSKLAANELIVVDNIDLQEIKTKNFVNFLNAVGAPNKALVVLPEVRPNVVRSANNVPNVKTTISSVINVYDIVNSGKFIIDKAAVAKIEEVYAQ